MLSTELLLQLTDETRVDFLEITKLGDRNINNNSLLVVKFEFLKGKKGLAT